LIVAVSDHTSSKPAWSKATDNAARPASVAYPWPHAERASRQPTSMPPAPGTSSGIGMSPVKPMNSLVPFTSSAHKS
jgi:hypothetical protein